jgi:phage terminase small subunit
MPEVLVPIRRLTGKEKKVFDRVVSDFDHLNQTSAEMLCRYSEAFVRYEDASKEVKRHPTVKQPVVNRSTGNVTGFKEIRNPAFRTLAEAQSQLNSLARRLLIDAASETKRLTLQSKKARSFSALEHEVRNERDIRASLTEEQIADGFERYLKRYVFPPWCDDEMNRELVIEWLCDPIFHLKPCTQEQISSGDCSGCEDEDDGL